MAGDWLKIRMDLPDEVEVFEIAERLDIETDAVVGKLIRLWAWASRHCRNDGYAPSVTPALLDRVTGQEGFAKAVSESGWLEVKKKGIAFPKFDRHNSQTAKQRALTANRMLRLRRNTSVTPSVTSASPEKRRCKTRTSSTPDAQSVSKETSTPAAAATRKRRAASEGRLPEDVSDVCQEALDFLDALAVNAADMPDIVRKLTATGHTPEDVAVWQEFLQRALEFGYGDVRDPLSFVRRRFPSYRTPQAAGCPFVSKAEFYGDGDVDES